MYTACPTARATRPGGITSSTRPSPLLSRRALAQCLFSLLTKALPLKAVTPERSTRSLSDGGRSLRPSLSTCQEAAC